MVALSEVVDAVAVVLSVGAYAVTGPPVDVRRRRRGVVRGGFIRIRSFYSEPLVSSLD